MDYLVQMKCLHGITLTKMFLVIFHGPLKIPNFTSIELGLKIVTRDPSFRPTQKFNEEKKKKKEEKSTENKLSFIYKDTDTQGELQEICSIDSAEKVKSKH